MTQKEFKEIISGLSDKIEIDNIGGDDEFDIETRKQITRRDEQYSELLNHFVDLTKKRNINKENNKWLYFRIIMGLLIAMNILIVAIVVILLVKCNGSELINAVPVFITAIAGFASSIIAIPLAITKYLFSTKEDKYITDIISHTQEHDLSSRKILIPKNTEESNKH